MSIIMIVVIKLNYYANMNNVTNNCCDQVK